MKFHIGTTNPNKVREMAAILVASGHTYAVAPKLYVAETEEDFRRNAILKAVAYAKAAGGITISEDSGLVIPALNGMPGPYSARFYDCQVDTLSKRIVSCNESGMEREEIDNLNNMKVLDLMAKVPDDQRQASFVVALIVADENGNVLFQAHGESHGTIARERRGDNGFGYDPIFIGGDTFGKTYAELDSMRKNLRSHRKRVLDEFSAWLKGGMQAQAAGAAGAVAL